MLKDSKTFSSFSSDDIPKAKQFYAETLGLDVTDEMDGLGLHSRRRRRVHLPEGRPHAGDLHGAELHGRRRRGGGRPAHGGRRPLRAVPGEIETDEKGIARAGDGGPTIAWFKDPAGNILSVVGDGARRKTRSKISQEVGPTLDSIPNSRRPVKQAARARPVRDRRARDRPAGDGPRRSRRPVRRCSRRSRTAS